MTERRAGVVRSHETEPGTVRNSQLKARMSCRLSNYDLRFQRIGD